MAKHVYPVSTGWFGGMGPHPVFLNAAEPWDADDPLVKANPEHFAAEPSFPLRRSPGAVEQATAAPGEKRTTTRRSKPPQDESAGE